MEEHDIWNAPPLAVSPLSPFNLSPPPIPFNLSFSLSSPPLPFNLSFSLSPPPLPFNLSFSLSPPPLPFNLSFSHAQMHTQKQKHYAYMHMCMCNHTHMHQRRCRLDSIHLLMGANYLHIVVIAKAKGKHRTADHRRHREAPTAKQWISHQREWMTSCLMGGVLTRCSRTCRKK